MCRYSVQVFTCNGPSCVREKRNTTLTNQCTFITSNKVRGSRTECNAQQRSSFLAATRGRYTCDICIEMAKARQRNKSNYYGSDTASRNSSAFSGNTSNTSNNW